MPEMSLGTFTLEQLPRYSITGDNLHFHFTGYQIFSAGLFSLGGMVHSHGVQGPQEADVCPVSKLFRFSCVKTNGHPRPVHDSTAQGVCKDPGDDNFFSLEV